ncbi:UDP-Glycosyltransferase/glycogen phosphorylase [Dacryopinax primogenitus]|uniref:UDP-Glycosyltransferase/glycogen phosphorylase n=1 Tax=Dacryopinax primogenitus (strain DJM 731) TaxID=1858805 RepID=M5GF98_DACPD|nr:UDP-Glycosyltransferase/glycogen phosphorylase [Dacryopinax primogenitus]EJU03973.1 UDP-Glycosyltransferase/glycogen phosphorylase [Dacryopinax primogenitus]
MVRHAIILPFFAWGHLRPECALAVTLLRRYTDLVICESLSLDPVLITDFDSQLSYAKVDFVKRAKDEMARQCVSEEERDSLLSRVRVIAYGFPQPPMTPELIQMVMSMDPRHIHNPTMESCSDAVDMIEKLIGERVFLDKLGQDWGPVGAVPNMLIADVMMGNVILPVKEKHNIWVFLWWVGNTASFTRMFAPLKHGGRAEGYADECEAIFADEERRNGRPFGDIARDMWIRDHRVPGDVVRLAGMPPYFQWEDFPQQFWFPTIYSSLAVGGKVVDAADGFMMTTLEELETDAHRDMIQWARPRRVLCFGPQLPPALLSGEGHASAEVLAKMDVKYHAGLAGATHGHTNGATNGHANGNTNGYAPVDPAIAFLDKALSVHGPHSAIYISFGSVFFPAEMHIKALFETLLTLEKPMPFIITISRGSLLDEMKAALEQSGRGLVVPWAPQQAMLSHPGLGWMLTHCGGGGTFESLSSAVPVIAWPFMGDQPQHALWVSQVLDTGFDLIQVRNGVPGVPALRGDMAAGGTGILGTEEAIKAELRETLERAQGKDGLRKRENAKKVKKIILNAVKEGGSVHKALGELDFLL